MVLIPINSQSRITSISVIHQGLQGHLAGQLIHLVVDVGRGPVDGLLKTFHRLGRELNLAMPYFAGFQFFDVLLFKIEPLKIRRLGRIAEALNRQITWELAQRIDIRNELQIALWTCLYVHRAEDEYFVRSARLNNLCNRLPRADCCYLVFTQADKFAEESIRLVGSLSLSERRHQQQRNYKRDPKSGSHHCP